MSIAINCNALYTALQSTRPQRVVNYSVISERELTFTFAIICRPSVCCLSVVGNVRAPYSGGSHYREYFYGVMYLGHPLTSTENFTDDVREIFSGSQWMAKVPNAVEILPKISTA